MSFPINHFLEHRSTTKCTAKCVLSFADITYFVSASFALDRRFNATSKKENNTEGMFTHQKFPKIDLLPVDPYNIDEKNQALKLLLVTAVVDLVLY